MEKQKDEFFNFIGCGFNVTKAKKITERLKTTNTEISDWKRMIFPMKKEGNTLSMCMINIDEERAKDVDTSIPIIIATVLTEGGPSHILIDGNHRVFKRLWIENKTIIEAYILTPDETARIMEGPLKSIHMKQLKVS